MNIRGVQGSSLVTKAGLSPMIADPLRSSTHTDPARDKIKSQASEKISMLQKKQLQVMTDWQMKNDEEVASAYRTTDGRLLVAAETVGSSQLFDDLQATDMSIQRAYDKEHRVPGTRPAVGRRQRDSTDDYGHQSTDLLHSESYKAPQKEGLAENAASAELIKEKDTAGEKLIEELCNRDLTHVRARYASSTVEDSPNQVYKTGHSRGTNTGNGLSTENPYDVAYAPIQEQVYSFHDRPQTALNHSAVKRKHRRHIQSAKLNDFHSRYNRGARFADHRNVAKALDVRSIHESLRELKEFFKPASRAAAAQLGLLTDGTSQAKLSELNTNHGIGRQSANNASSHTSLRPGTRVYKVTNKSRPLRSCLARNCRVESTVATEQYFEEQMKHNYSDFLIQKKSKQLDLLDLFQLLILNTGDAADAAKEEASGSQQAHPPASFEYFPISIHDTYMIQVSRQRKSGNQKATSVTRKQGKNEEVITSACVTTRITESTTSLEKVLVESVPSSKSLRQNLKEILEKYVQVAAGQDSSINADDLGALHRNQMIGYVLAPNDKRKVVMVKHLSSTAEFEALCASMIPKKEVKRQNLVLQIDNPGLNTQRASALVGQWLAIQEYEYKGQVEGKGHIDKLFTGLISKQIYVQLLAEGKSGRMGQYVVSIDDQKSTQGTSVNSQQASRVEYLTQNGLKDLEHVLDGPPLHGPAQSQLALFYKRGTKRSTTPGLTELTAQVNKSSVYGRASDVGLDKSLSGVERALLGKAIPHSYSIPTHGPQYTTNNWSISSKESMSQLPSNPQMNEDLHTSAVSNFDVDFNQHSRKLIHWIQTRVSQLFDEKAEEARVKVKKARFIYEIGITQLRLASIENIQIDFEIPDTAKPVVANLKKRIKINMGKQESEKEVSKSEVKKMIVKGEESVSSKYTQQQENSLEDQLGGLNRAALYEGLKAVGLNYGKTEKYRQPIVQKPSNSRVNFVKRQLLHAKRQHKLNLERQRVTPSKSPSSHSFLTNYPQFMDKQSSSAHSKFLFGSAQNRSNESLLKKYKSLVGRREASDRYFIMGKDGMMRSENFRQENLITKKGKESIFGGLIMSEYNSYTVSNNDLGTNIAQELGKTRPQLVKEQVTRDMQQRVMSGKSSDGDRESAYHLYMSRARDVNSIPKNLQVEMNRSMLDESMALSTSFKDLQDVTVLDKQTQKQIRQEVRKKLKQSEEELRKSRTSESMMLIAAEFEAIPANPSYYMYKKQRNRYGKNQDIRDQIRMMANPKDEQARLAAIEYGTANNNRGGSVECNIPVYYEKIEAQPLAPYMTREISTPDLRTENKDSAEIVKSRKHLLEVEKRVPAPRILPSAKVEKSTASLQSQRSKTGSVGTYRQHLYGYQEVAIGIQGRQVRTTAQLNTGGRRLPLAQQQAGGLLAETSSIRSRAADGSVETLEVTTECLASLLAKVSAHQCGGQITIGTTDQQPNEGTVDVEVPGFDQLLKFSVSAFLNFCQVARPNPQNAKQYRVKKLSLRNAAIQSTRNNNQIPLSNQLVKSNESVNSRSSRKVILSNHNVSSQVLNRMHDSVCSEKSGSLGKRKQPQATDENGLAILQMESADSLTMFDRLPIGTHRGPTGGATEALIDRAPKTSSQLIRNQNGKDMIVGGSQRQLEIQAEGAGLVNEASIFDNLIIKSSSRERPKPQFQQVQKETPPIKLPATNKQAYQRTDSPAVAIPRVVAEQSPHPTNDSARDDYRPQVSRQIKKNADPSSLRKPNNSSQKRQLSSSGRKSCTLSVPSRDNLTANMDYVGIGTGASPKDATPHAAQSKKSLSIVEIMQQTMAEDVGKKPGSQKDPTEGDTVRNATPGKVQAPHAGLDEPIAGPPPADVAKQAVHNLEISRQSTATKNALSWQHLDKILVLQCSKCQPE